MKIRASLGSRRGCSTGVSVLGRIGFNGEGTRNPPASGQTSKTILDRLTQIQIERFKGRGHKVIPLYLERDMLDPE